MPTPSPTPTSIPTPGASSTRTANRLQRVLDAEYERYAMIGLGAAVYFPDGTMWSGAAGFADIENRVAASAGTGFVVGSVSKTFVTATVMQLAEEGVLSIDDPLSLWLPEYPNGNQITLRQVLSHTSGIFNYFEHPTYNRLVFGSPRRMWEPAEVVATFDAPPYFTPGTGYHYSNTGFVLLGLIIEAATGNSLGDEYRARFFERLGLERAHFQGDGPAPFGVAHGYLAGANGPRKVSDGTDYRPTTSAATVAWAAGAVVASAPDLAVWGHALYGGRLLAPESLSEMTNFSANPYARARYGLGTRTAEIDGRQVVGHTGSLRGYASVMWHFPAEDLTVVVLSNRGRIDVSPVGERLALAALRAAGYGAP